MDGIKCLNRLCLDLTKVLQRSIFAAVLLFAAALFLPGVGFSLTGTEAEVEERKLDLYHLHTNEKLSVVYKRNGNYLAEGLRKIDHILRDHRTEQVYPIDPELLDFLYELQGQVNNRKAIHIVCGYRSPKTNASLRSRSSGVAQKSLHMQGKALDFRLPGTSTAVLRDRARAMKRGGVGYYQKSDFVQIDTGRVRNW